MADHAIDAAMDDGARCPVAERKREPALPRRARMARKDHEGGKRKRDREIGIKADRV